MLGWISGWPAGIKVLGAVLIVAVTSGGAAFAATRFTHPPRQVVIVNPTTPQPTPRATPSPSPSPSPAPRLPLAQSLNCRIAVSGGGPGSGGFVTFPGGAFAVDPASNITPPANEVGDGGMGGPYGYGSAGNLYYDSAFGKWVPTAVNGISPDGAHYAYTTQAWDQGNSLHSELHVVDVASGTNTTLKHYLNYYLSLVDYESSGIYFEQGPIGPGSVQGLWVVNPANNQTTQLASNGNWWLVGPEYAWGTAPGNPQNGVPDRLLRLDLASGAEDTYFERPGLGIGVLGADASGNPVIQAASNVVTELWIVTAPGQGDKLYTGPGSFGSSGLRASSALADSHGLWIGTQEGLYLYSPDGRFEKVSSASGTVSGACH